MFWMINPLDHRFCGLFPVGIYFLLRVLITLKGFVEAAFLSDAGCIWLCVCEKCRHLLWNQIPSAPLTCSPWSRLTPVSRCLPVGRHGSHLQKPLTKAPDVTLVCVGGLQDWLQGHPLDRNLEETNRACSTEWPVCNGDWMDRPWYRVPSVNPPFLHQRGTLSHWLSAAWPIQNLWWLHDWEFSQERFLLPGLCALGGALPGSSSPATTDGHVLSQMWPSVWLFIISMVTMWGCLRLSLCFFHVCVTFKDCGT